MSGGPCANSHFLSFYVFHFLLKFLLFVQVSSFSLHILVITKLSILALSMKSYHRPFSYFPILFFFFSFLSLSLTFPLSLFSVYSLWLSPCLWRCLCMSLSFSHFLSLNICLFSVFVSFSVLVYVSFLFLSLFISLSVSLSSIYNLNCHRMTQQAKQHILLNDVFHILKTTQICWKNSECVTKAF